MRGIRQCVDARHGEFKRVLCVCFGNQLRSPTAALVLANPPFNFNTRSCGLDENTAVCLIDDTLVSWADEIVMMEQAHLEFFIGRFGTPENPVKVLNIPDNYAY